MCRVHKAWGIELSRGTGTLAGVYHFQGAHSIRATGMRTATWAARKQARVAFNEKFKPLKDI